MKREGKDDGTVHRISAATKPLSQDIDQRTRRYLISMAIRTLCFIGCVLAFVRFDQPIVGWILLIGAAILPYIAVVIANGGRERTDPLPTATLDPGATALGPGEAGPTTPGSGRD